MLTNQTHPLSFLGLYCETSSTYDDLLSYCNEPNKSSASEPTQEGEGFANAATICVPAKRAALAAEARSQAFRSLKGEKCSKNLYSALQMRNFETLANLSTVFALC